MQISFLPHSDERLLEKFAKAQRQKAIAYLKNQFSLPIDDCEDVFQEAFITLYNNIQEGKLKELTSLITKGTTPLDKSGKGVVNFIKVENVMSHSLL